MDKEIEKKKKTKNQVNVSELTSVILHHVLIVSISRAEVHRGDDGGLAGRPSAVGYRSLSASVGVPAVPCVCRPGDASQRDRGARGVGRPLLTLDEDLLRAFRVPSPATPQSQFPFTGLRSTPWTPRGRKIGGGSMARSHNDSHQEGLCEGRRVAAVSPGRSARAHLIPSFVPHSLIRSSHPR